MDSFSKVPFAVVSLKGKMTATTSDEAGYFEIQCNITDTLVLGHVTYQRTYISIKKLVETSGKNIKIYLKRKQVELVPVTITGKRLSQEKKEEYSNELQITAETPPAFLVHSSNDDGVSPMNSVEFYNALVKNKVPAELHLYQSGGHGFGLYMKNSKELWMDRCKNWLLLNGWLNSNN